MGNEHRYPQILWEWRGGGGVPSFYLFTSIFSLKRCVIYFNMTCCYNMWHNFISNSDASFLLIPENPVSQTDFPLFLFNLLQNTVQRFIAHFEFAMENYPRCWRNPGTEFQQHMAPGTGENVCTRGREPADVQIRKLNVHIRNNLFWLASIFGRLIFLIWYEWQERALWNFWFFGCWKALRSRFHTRAGTILTGEYVIVAHHMHTVWSCTYTTRIMYCTKCRCQRTSCDMPIAEFDFHVFRLYRRFIFA